MVERFIPIGVRHHSPACAQLVTRTIQARQPAFVLIEGPADFNPWLQDLNQPHRLPIAIFSYCSTPGGARAYYAPFCTSSPEWQALQAAWACGATPLFCDLPAWHLAPERALNRYADPHHLYQRHQALTAALAEQLEVDGRDVLWDRLVEQADPADLPPILDQFFSALRGPADVDPAEAAREQFMARMVAWALAAAGSRPVVLVCGGWHVGGVRAALAALAPPPPAPDPPAPDPPPADARADSYLTPYSFDRLDSFAGYAAGMPSPGYYDQLHRHGLSQAADWGMAQITTALRRYGLPVSTADRIVWHSSMHALARLRGHRQPLRADLLDAAISALAKDALATPPAWTRRGRLQREDDDLVLAMLVALTGDAVGQLAPSVRQPPLVADLQQELAAQNLTPTRPARHVTLDWLIPEDRARAQICHRLLLLELPGVTRTAGPAQADATDLRESFELLQHPDWLAGAIQAARFGGNLAMAAAAALEARPLTSAPALATALTAGLFAGLFAANARLTDALCRVLPTCFDLEALGATGQRLAALLRYSDVFAAEVTALQPLCSDLFDRLPSLCASAGGDGRSAIPAILAVRDLARAAERLTLDLAPAEANFLRLAHDNDAPPRLAGAALGYLVACGRDRAAATRQIDARLRRFGLPEQLGDFLSGLFVVARQELTEAADLLAAVHGLIMAWPDETFLEALPTLRDAFAWFPPREREDLAQLILRRDGASPTQAELTAHDWLHLPVAPEQQAAAMAAERTALQQLARYGLAALPP